MSVAKRDPYYVGKRLNDSRSSIRLVHIVWEDCIADQSGWMGQEELADWETEELPLVHTAGFLVSDEDAGFILVAGSVSDDVSRAFAEVQKIPRRAIHEIRILDTFGIDTWPTDSGATPESFSTKPELSQMKAKALSAD